MAHASKADRRVAAGPNIVPVALFSSGAAIVALAIVWQHAQNYGPAQLDRGASVAQQALHAHGLGWARVTQRDGFVNIAGSAPSEAARVMAFQAARRALRPLMGREASITGIRSLVVLRGEPEPFGRYPVTPPLDIAGLLPPPMPLVHEAAVRHVTLDVTSATPDEKQRAGAESTSGIETGALTRTDPSSGPAERTAAPSQEPDLAALDTDEVADGAATAGPEQPQLRAVPQQTAARDAAIERALEDAAASQAGIPEAAAQVAAAEPEAIQAESVPQADACADAFADALDGTTVNFAHASSVIQKESRPLLDKLAAIAKRCKGYRFTVEGHTDLTGSRAANLTLSKKRAEAVRWALIDRGIDMDHIAAEGFGASRPLENATSDEANARNRRIAIMVREAAPRRAAK